jgi:hypothetical protein
MKFSESVCDDCADWATHGFIRRTTRIALTGGQLAFPEYPVNAAQLEQSKMTVQAGQPSQACQALLPERRTAQPRQVVRPRGLI